VQEASFNSAGVIGFLKQLLGWIEGKVMVMWDVGRSTNPPQHTGATLFVVGWGGR
jgi:hypothetical protein